MSTSSTPCSPHQARVRPFGLNTALKSHEPAGRAKTQSPVCTLKTMSPTDQVTPVAISVSSGLQPGPRAVPLMPRGPRGIAMHRENLPLCVAAMISSVPFANAIRRSLGLHAGLPSRSISSKLICESGSPCRRARLEDWLGRGRSRCARSARRRFALERRRCVTHPRWCWPWRRAGATPIRGVLLG